MPLSFLVVGDASLTLQCISSIVTAGHEIAGVSTTDSGVAEWCDGTNTPRFELDDPNPPTADYLLSIVNLRMLPEWLLTHPKVAAINFHDGPLPAFAGLNAPVWAILEGAREFGVSWHLMTAGADRGDILEQDLFEVDLNETALSLNTRCFDAGQRSFARILARCERRDMAGMPQDFSRRTYFGLKKRAPHAGVIDPNSGLEAAERLVRALDFGPYQNPVGLSKLASVSGSIAVGSMTMERGERSELASGTIIKADSDSLTIAFPDGSATFTGLANLDGAPLTGSEALVELTTQVGQVLGLDPVALARFDVLASEAARHESSIMANLASASDSLELPMIRPTFEGASGAGVVETPALRTNGSLLAVFGTFIASLTGSGCIVSAATDERLSATEGCLSIFAPFVPVQFPANVCREEATRLSESADRLPPIARDLFARAAHLGTAPTSGDRVGLVVSRRQPDDARGFDLLLHVNPDANTWRWHFSQERFAAGDIQCFAAAFQSFARRWDDANSDAQEIGELISEQQAEQFRAWNETQTRFPSDSTVAQKFEDAVARHPELVAVRGAGSSYTYATLNSRANRLAHHLIGQGVGPDVLVGVHLERSLDLVVALLAIHKAGGAYVPIDPTYPESRKVLMLEDSGAGVVITDASNNLPGALPLQAVVRIEDLENLPKRESNPVQRSSGENLAYVIYTSGSTGRPKGVMVEHRNVLNFFEGMDNRVGIDPGVWLAVTSISFDISVLELLWTLTRGFTVVVQGARPQQAKVTPALSLYFFASESGADGNPFDLLLKASKIADERGFQAVWMPERHFHEFGGAFPNPSVAAAAVAATTKRIGIRAGSCVLPLHSPIRVAEEWAMVDQVSQGRVGVSFASGWQPQDFVLNPASFGGGKQQLERDIATVQSLWRGDSAAFPGHDGELTQISTLPRPVQSELPTWLTSAGDPETFRMAGRLGLNVLTHLLGQSVEELSEKLAIYREARAAAGWSGAGHVTLMLHTFISDDIASAKETVREPLIQYLASSVGLIKNFASSFPAFKRLPEGSSANDLLAQLSEAEMRELMEIAFERYFESSGLFGDHATAQRTLAKVREAGVDEVACLVDFGVAHQTVLQGLDRLAALTAQSTEAPEESVGESIRKYGVTHLQCTPSMAGMLIADPVTAEALGQLKAMLVGGEALPIEVACGLRELVPGTFLNMYGPTETTVWSTVSEILTSDSSVTIGTPIANTSIYILNSNLRRLPPGFVGELWIGGEGVTRGYFNRSELTAERFVPDPFGGCPSARMYRTGDLARYRADGTIEFLGRVDQQVKVRGYRIEPGEIESVVRSIAGIAEAVVIAREDDPGDQRLVCYFVASGDAGPSERILRDTVAGRLPVHMVPTNFVAMNALPLTPNKKIDRNALPRPGASEIAQKVNAIHNDSEGARSVTEPRPASAEALQLVQTVWLDVLKTSSIERDRTFFDCGGNSLLLLQVHRRLSEHHAGLRITDLFKHPTINSLASHLSSNEVSTASLDDASRRAAARRAASGRRPVHV